MIVLLAIAMIVGDRHRRIRAATDKLYQCAKRGMGRRMYGGQSTYIPLKVNQSGVIPVIFASSLLLVPGDPRPGEPVARRPDLGQQQPHGPERDQPGRTSSLYTLMIVFFAYFYTTNSVSTPLQQADIIRKQGGFIPGIRPGPPTEEVPREGAEPHHAAGRLVPDGRASRSRRSLY